jgi:hypothetical protein
VGGSQRYRFAARSGGEMSEVPARWPVRQRRSAVPARSLAPGASEQAASLEETSSSSQEINSMAAKIPKTPARPQAW